MVLPSAVEEAREVPPVTTDAVLEDNRGVDRPAIDPDLGVLCPAGPVPAAPARRTARLLVVDGEAIVRYGLRQLFASDRCPPDVVLLDVDLGRGDSAGVDLARMLMERHRGLRVLVFTGCRDRELMLRTVRLGVHGYLRKGADTAEIVRAVRTLLRGESVFDSRPGAVSVDGLRNQEAPPARGFGTAMLTERENQVLRLLAVGMSNREIGRRLVISEATVKFHVRNLRDKLDVRRRTEIVYTATRHGMV
jgi:two-component system response regulator DevR